MTLPSTKPNLPFSSPSTMHAPNLHALPPELLQQILLHADPLSLSALRQTCTKLQTAADDEALWRQLVQRRFRVSTTVLRSRRLLSIGGISWRELYVHWDASGRMPTSRMSGNTHPAFARGQVRGRGALVWITVVSTDDCRLVAGSLRLRVVVQNVAGGEMMRFQLAKASVRLTDGHVIDVNDRHLSYRSLNRSHDLQYRTGKGRLANHRTRTCRARGTAQDKSLPFHLRPPISPVRALSEVYQATVVECFIGHAGEVDGEDTFVKKRRNNALGKDDFAILTVDIYMPCAQFEIDALERLQSMHIPVSWGSAGEAVPLIADFQERVMWENYERLPGGWWVRAETSSSRF